MRHLFFVLILVSLMMGCASTEVKSLSSPEQISSCQFDKMPSQSYVLNPSITHRTMTLFFYDPTRYLNQFESQHYQDLMTQPFKVFKTGVISQESLAMRKPSLAKFRMIEEGFNGKVYQRDQSLSTKIITKNCRVYYARGNKLNKSVLANALLKIDQSQLTENDLLDFYGQEALLEKDLSPKIEFDAAENIWRLDSPRYQDSLLQGIVDQQTKAVLNIQLYAELDFTHEWGQIQSAEDKNGQPLKLQLVATRSNCSFKLTQCIRTEMVRVQLNLTLLKPQIEDFEIRFYGIKEKTLKVPPELIRKFLEGLEQAAHLIPPQRLSNRQ